MSAAVLAMLIGAGVDILTGLIGRYQDLPDTPEEMRMRLQSLKVSLLDTKAQVEAVVIKDV